MSHQLLEVRKLFAAQIARLQCKTWSFSANKTILTAAASSQEVRGSDLALDRTGVKVLTMFLLLGWSVLMCLSSCWVVGKVWPQLQV